MAWHCPHCNNDITPIPVRGDRIPCIEADADDYTCPNCGYLFLDGELQDAEGP